ncbi:MAG: hypothetical protein AB1715_13995, partial [Acidobacteriota bacterium]
GPSSNTRPVIHTIRKSQLKKKPAPSLPLPKEMKKALQVTVAALRRSDQNLRDSVAEMSRRGVVVRKEDIASPKLPGKIIPLERFAKEHEGEFKSPGSPVVTSPQEAARGALRAVELNHIISKIRLWMAPSTDQSRATEAVARGEIRARPDRMALPQAAPAFRFRDWNPDVRIAGRLGVNISYSSRTNEISCPQLGFSSRHVTPSFRLGENGFTRLSMSGGHGPLGSASSSFSSSHSAGSHSSGAGHSGGAAGGGTKGNK